MAIGRTRTLGGALLAAVIIFLSPPLSADTNTVSPAGKKAVAKPIFFKERIRVINMIPNAQSGETGQDSEPNLAVDPANINHLVGSAFTENPTGATNRAPIYVSQDRGATWTLNNIVPSGNGMTGDISVAYPTLGGTLYAGILRGGSWYRLNLLRAADPFGATAMTVLVDRNDVDQPWMEARTTNQGGVDFDRVIVGNNDFNATNNRTASAEVSLDAATNPAPAGFSTARLDVRNTMQQDLPAIRTTVHGDGTTYAVFYGWRSGNLPNPSADVVVVRDDNWASGASPYTALTDPGDGLAGMRVAQNVVVPSFPANLGANRLVASNLSIAVDPRNSNNIWVAWAGRDPATNAYTLFVRRSTDRGVTWSGNLLTVGSATNPALAINSAGLVGFLYQQLAGSGATARWETHFRRTTQGLSWSDVVLANTPDNNPTPTFQPYIGDYADVVAVGKRFFGVFSASNIPDLANFPKGVTYQRTANFTAHTLLDVDGTTAVSPSIDPFFFRIEPPMILDICKLNPKQCARIDLKPGLLQGTCLLKPCRVIDPIPKNCLVKFSCPGCGGKALCPPWYHLYVDGLDPEVWKVDIFTSGGDYVKQSLRRTGKGVVLSFRPSKRLFQEGMIGDYVLALESDKINPGKKFSFPMRLETSDYPLDEHVRRTLGDTMMRMKSNAPPMGK